MPDASSIKWHLGQTTWFFETFILRPNQPDYRDFDPTLNYLINSYYEAVGPHQLRAERGLIKRPAIRDKSVKNRTGSMRSTRTITALSIVPTTKPN